MGNVYLAAPLLNWPAALGSGPQNTCAPDFFLALPRNRGCTVTQFVFRSRLDFTYRAALEQALFFNPGQRESERGIAEGVEIHGAPMIVSDPAGMHVVVSSRHDAQCLFALAPRANRLILAGIIIFLRTSRDDMTVLHVAVADQFIRNRAVSLSVAMALVGAVREITHRIRGIKRLRLLYLRDRPVAMARATAAARWI